MSSNSERTAPLADVSLGDIHRDSVSDKVVTELRRAVLDGAIAPGTPLREVPLAERFRVSRNTIREALRALAHEGIVTHNMHKGAVVTEHTATDIVDIFDARRTLELAAARQSSKVDEGQIEHFKSLLTDMENAAADGDYEKLVRLDLDFHHDVVAILASRRLLEFFRNLQREIRLGLLLLDRAKVDLSEYAESHRQIVSLLENQESAKLESFLREHIDSAERNLIDSLPASQSEPLH